MLRWISGLIVGIGLVAVLVGGCGGGDETSSTLTKAEYTKQADQICAKRKKEWETVLAPYEKKFTDPKHPPNQKEKREVAEELLQKKMLPALVVQQKSLEELDAPEGKEKQVDAMLASLSQSVADIEKDGVAALIEGEYGNFSKEAEDFGLNCPL